MLKIQPQALMDREKKDELPSLQIGWIDGICLPLYKASLEYFSLTYLVHQRLLEPCSVINLLYSLDMGPYHNQSYLISIQSLARMDSVFEPMLERVLENRKQWELMNLRRITMGTSKETDV